MSIWNTILSAAIIGAILESLRFLAKRISITTEYRMELVRRRLNAYEDIFNSIESTRQSLYGIDKVEGDLRPDIVISLYDLRIKHYFYLSSYLDKLLKDAFIMSVNLDNCKEEKKYHEMQNDLSNHIDIIHNCIRKEAYSGKMEKLWKRAARNK